MNVIKDFLGNPKVQIAIGALIAAIAEWAIGFIQAIAGAPPTV